MHALLDAGFWRGALFEEGLTMQATMFQPVGGMDRIAYAFAGKLGPVVQYDAPVSEIRKTANGVRIVYTQAGSRKLLEADYCICALPLALVKSIPNDFSARIKQAIAKTEYADGFKIAWESKRFWETDFNIYGGISWVVSGPVELVWYPSARLFSEKGVLISGYVNWGKIAENLGSWVAARDGAPPAASAVSSGRQPAPTAANAVRPTSYYDGPYKEFIQPDERMYFAGDHCARIGAWQEGAALAAHRAAQMIGDRVRMTRLTSRQTAG
jgi:monoamine oxidase